MAANRTEEATAKERHDSWYAPDLTEAPSPIRALLETYSKVPADKVVEHINKVRASGFATNPYPCIGMYRFLNLTLISHPQYQQILRLLQSNPSARFLDLGCCFGQDLRQLVADGVPSSQLIGMDIAGPLMEVGYDLFLDRDTLKSKFGVGDVFKGPEQGEPWASAERNGIDIVHASALLHLFPREQQVVAANNIARLVRSGGMIVGRQSGSVKPGEVPAIDPGATSFRHDPETFQALWDEVGQATGTKWKVEASLDMVGIVLKNRTEDENSRRLLFTVHRVE